MKHRIYQGALFLFLFSLWIPAIHAQDNISLHFQGVMKDIEENLIKNDKFKLTVNVLDAPAGTTLWEKSLQVTTDEEGWFGFGMEEFDRLFGDEQSGSAKVSVHLGLFPLPESKWIEQGNDFLVSYTITRIIGNDSILFTITRMEGSKLQTVQQEHLLFFSDSYPFAYLQGGFILTSDNTSENIEALQSIIKGDAAGSEAARSRGIKGSFAVGGYRKNQ